MGANMARRLMKAGHSCVVTDLSADAVAAMARDGATGAGSLEALVASLSQPRVVWVMVPAGEATERTVATLGTLAVGRRHRHRRRQLVVQRRRAAGRGAGAHGAFATSMRAPAAASGAPTAGTA